MPEKDQLAFLVNKAPLIHFLVVEMIWRYLLWGQKLTISS